MKANNQIIEEILFQINEEKENRLTSRQFDLAIEMIVNRYVTINYKISADQCYQDFLRDILPSIPQNCIRHLKQVINQRLFGNWII